ncbi:hypothetical protein [Streptomyces iconiensis]|uniref:HNH endonuclease n=1 Tax=Streptomyces iconiensis TaxID=1384038 RepID=A0ABT6ZRQ6_9ACTN|nr:hypothetical protein [Streptomyces iconiensis]MDJ1131747.1 hypothetical protein [Streptomyces iconiensis]
MTAPAATLAPDGLARAFGARTAAVEGGHREWTGGSRTASGAGRFRHQGRDFTAYQAAFILRTGREPIGSVRPTCDYPRCCEPAHADDQATRQRDRAALAAVVGMAHRPPSCDHDQAVHGRHRADGKRYCNACNNPAADGCGHGNPTCGRPDARPYPCGPRCEEHQPSRTRPYRTAP